MSAIKKLLEDYADSGNLDYKNLIANRPWIVRENMKCILSPDSDGFLCGLLMCYMFNWSVIGFYDGKVMLIQNGYNATDDDVCFLDIEIYRPDVRSIGHHMVSYNNRIKPSSWEINYQHCIQPNNMRGYDGKNSFRLKYPLATIHLLLGIVGSVKKVPIPVSAIAPLFFVDGVFQVLYSYPENVLNWLDYLGIEEPTNPLRDVFLHEHFSVFKQIRVMDNFFRLRDEITLKTENGEERGDRLKISKRNGDVCNLNFVNKNRITIDENAKSRMFRFLRLLSENTGWFLNESHWLLDDLKVHKLKKQDFQSMGWSLTNSNFNKLMEQNPLSWAMTSGLNIEFTLDENMLFK